MKSDANSTNEKRLARKGSCGLSTPVSTGITPGSAPAHFGLFGYDPIRFPIGRGVLEGVGIGFDIKTGDIAARGKFEDSNRDYMRRKAEQPEGMRATMSDIFY